MSGAAELIDFCDRWLDAWTGNRPEALLAFYAPNAAYLDPARPQGLQGHDQLLPYFRKLLAANPEWVWRRVELHPTAQGFMLKWQATVPVRGGEPVRFFGLDLVELHAGKICRNEVYFDRTALLPPASKPAHDSTRRGP